MEIRLFGRSIEEVKRKPNSMIKALRLVANTTGGEREFEIIDDPIIIEFSNGTKARIDGAVARVYTAISNSEVGSPICLTHRSVHSLGMRLQEAVYFFNRVLRARNHEMVAGFYLHACLGAIYAFIESLREVCHRRINMEAYIWRKKLKKAVLEMPPISKVLSWRSATGHRPVEGLRIKYTIGVTLDANGATRMSNIIDENDFHHDSSGNANLADVRESIILLADALAEMQSNGWLETRTDEPATIRIQVFEEGDRGVWFEQTGAGELRGCDSDLPLSVIELAEQSKLRHG